MCGIAGLSLAVDHPVAPEVIREMLSRIAHRGPDSDGYFASPTTQHGRVHLGFRRLAIRDLDARANQPMVSASGKTAIVFNGEVYNSEELARRYLAGFHLRTTGDTEVLLETIERHGIGIVDQFNGMFGLAAVDLSSGQLMLARDRMGKKPLYIYEHNGVLAFGSELRTLKPFGLQINPDVANLFLHFGYFPSPYTFFQNTTQVCPGEIVEVQGGKTVAKRHYHHFYDQPWAQENATVDQIDSLLHDAVQIRKLSDVPLGAFLSGGVDSALVAAHLKEPTNATSSDPLPTFTVAFEDRAHNEADGAAETARLLGLSNEVIAIEEQDLDDLATQFLDCYEQPYADTSGLVTMLLCRSVKQRVTVALSGDGGDEFYGGYARYTWFQKALLAQRFPASLRSIAALGCNRLGGRRGPRLARWLNAKDPAALYAEILRNWNATSFDAIVDHAPTTVTATDLVRDNFEKTMADPMSQAACFDATYYIPDDLQVKLDRASMQVALEVRCPLLDFRFAGLGISLGTGDKYQDGPKTKLKQCLGRHVPQHVLDRPKHGFNVPLAKWLSGPLRNQIDSTLTRQDVRECGWLQESTANHVWQEFLAGKRQNAHSVWMLFSLSHHLQPTVADSRFTELVAANNRRAAA